MIKSVDEQLWDKEPLNTRDLALGFVKEAFDADLINKPILLAERLEDFLDDLLAAIETRRKEIENAATN